LTPRFEMADYRRSAFIYDKTRLLVPVDAGVGEAPDERPGGIPGDLGEVARQKSTVDPERGYAATWRGSVILDSKGKTYMPTSAGGELLPEHRGVKGGK